MRGVKVWFVFKSDRASHPSKYNESPSLDLQDLSDGEKRRQSQQSRSKRRGWSAFGTRHTSRHIRPVHARKSETNILLYCRWRCRLPTSWIINHSGRSGINVQKTVELKLPILNDVCTEVTKSTHRHHTNCQPLLLTFSIWVFMVNSVNSYFCASDTYTHTGHSMIIKRLKTTCVCDMCACAMMGARALIYFRI